MKTSTSTILLWVALLGTRCQGFAPPSLPTVTRRPTTRLFARRKKANTNVNPNNNNNSNNQEGEVGEGDNWIERSFPVDTGGKAASAALKKVEGYNLGISGISFQTGSLSKRT